MVVCGARELSLSLSLSRFRQCKRGAGLHWRATRRDPRARFSTANICHPGHGKQTLWPCVATNARPLSFSALSDILEEAPVAVRFSIETITEINDNRSISLVDRRPLGF